MDCNSLEMGADHLASLTDEDGVELFKSSMANRVTYPNSMLNGSAPNLYEPKGKASQEVKALTDELLERINS